MKSALRLFTLAVVTVLATACRGPAEGPTGPSSPVTPSAVSLNVTGAVRDIVQRPIGGASITVTNAGPRVIDSRGAQLVSERRGFLWATVSPIADAFTRLSALATAEVEATGLQRVDHDERQCNALCRNSCRSDMQRLRKLV